MSLTTFMNLTAWTASTDPYSHVELASNFNLIDGHDHASGKGKQIPTGGIADHAVTQIKLADASVGNDQIIDNSVTADKLDGALLAAIVPMGFVYPFWRPAGASTVIWGNRASGHLFELCDGRTIVQAEHDLGVASSIVLPNLIDKFALFGAEADIGVTGGSNSASLSHSHTVNSHSHTVNSHGHTVNAHAHTIGDHRHGISDDGSHGHTFAGGHFVHSRQNAFLGGIQVQDVNTFVRSNTLQSLYLASYDPVGDALASMDPAGLHGHGGQTGLVSTGNLGTSDASPGTSSASPATNAQSPGTSSALGTTDNRPAHMKLVPLVRVRNP